MMPRPENLGAVDRAASYPASKVSSIPRAQGSLHLNGYSETCHSRLASQIQSASPRVNQNLLQNFLHPCNEEAASSELAIRRRRPDSLKIYRARLPNELTVCEDVSEF